MKKHLFTLLLVVSMLATFVGTAAAAPLASGTAELVGVVYVPGKGPVYTFQVSGNFSKEELTGWMHVDGEGDYALHCWQEDAVTVKCSSDKVVSNVKVVLSWGGSKFWTTAPVAKYYCYGVWDYDKSNTWKNYGENCQEKPAQYGDVISWYNPDFGDNLDHIFLPDLACVGLYGDAYYYPYCPL
jgi:hypothetical protein